MIVTRASSRCLLLFVSILCLSLVGCGNDNGQRNDLSQATVPAKTAKAEPLVTGLPDFTKLVKQVSPAVVNISALSPSGGPGDSSDAPGSTEPGADAPDGLRDWLKRFFGGEPDPNGPPAPDLGEHISLGSGFIISANGYILTNRHVIAGAGQIVVKLNDHRQLLAKVVGADADSDVAVLKVDAKNLPTVKIGDSSKLEAGAWVVAIGSPFGFDTSVTAGIVSAVDRTLTDNQYVPFLQTDVPINPGNSGGPLFNLDGQVVGINSQIYSQTGGYQGISFAIPINFAINIAEQLQKNGKVARGWLGVQIQDVSRQMAQSFDLSRPVGALVTQIMKNSPAANSGLQVGDVILSFNGHPVDSAADLPPLVGVVPPGDKARVTVLRNGDREQLSVTIKALPPRYDHDDSQKGRGEPKAPPVHPFGLSLAPLTDQARQQLGIEKHGVVVTAISRGAGAQAGLQPGDVILSVGNQDVDKPADVINALQQAKGTVALLVVRDGARRYIAMNPHSKPDQTPGTSP